ncbi:MAG TPA: hypothetical protein VFN75_01415 [Pseudonocardiaceae bacterium]|nr:hypothetical protein [Pseudonocardiaceae bacterium]
MRRTLWFGLGIAAGIAASRKARARVRQLTPAGAAENISDAMRELATAFGSFGADVRAGMVEREAQLHAAVAHRTGTETAPRHAVSGASRSGLTRTRV